VPIFHTVFARVYHCAISELCKDLYTIAMESDTSPHVLRFTPVSTTGASAAAVEQAFLTNARRR
jgi:hypothetical protein